MPILFIDPSLTAFQSQLQAHYNPTKIIVGVLMGKDAVYLAQTEEDAERFKVLMRDVRQGNVTSLPLYKEIKSHVQVIDTGGSADVPVV